MKSERMLVMLEPYAVKVACTVLRGEESRETLDLLGLRHEVAKSTSKIGVKSYI